MKKTLLFLLLLCSFNSFSQLENFSNQYWNNLTLLNPSMAGVQHALQGGLSYRDLNSNIADNPQILAGFFNTKLKEVHGLGVDLAYQNIYSYGQNFNISIPYSYRIPGQKGSLNFGLAPSYNFSHIQLDAFYLDSAGNFSPYTIDDRQHNLSVHSGISIVRERWNAGISARNLSLLAISDSIQPYSFSGEYFANFFYNFDFKGFGSYDPNSKIKGTLGLLFGTDVENSSILQIDARLMFWQKLTIFGGYRSENSGFVGAGWDVRKKYSAMYSYQWDRSNLNNGISSPNHEIRLIYKLPKSK